MSNFYDGDTRHASPLPETEVFYRVTFGVLQNKISYTKDVRTPREVGQLVAQTLELGNTVHSIIVVMQEVRLRELEPSRFAAEIINLDLPGE